MLIRIMIVLFCHPIYPDIKVKTVYLADQLSMSVPHFKHETIEVPPGGADLFRQDLSHHGTFFI
jgi:hypothetical protein